MVKPFGRDAAGFGIDGVAEKVSACACCRIVAVFGAGIPLGEQAVVHVDRHVWSFFDFRIHQ